MLSISEVGDILDRLAEELPPEFYRDLSGGILLVICGWKLIPLMRLSGGWIAFSVAQLLVFAEFLTIIIRA